MRYDGADKDAIHAAITEHNESLPEPVDDATLDKIVHRAMAWKKGDQMLIGRSAA
jgi:hypothetical protein